VVDDKLIKIKLINCLCFCYRRRRRPNKMDEDNSRLTAQKHILQTDPEQL